MSAGLLRAGGLSSTLIMLAAACSGPSGDDVSTTEPAAQSTTTTVVMSSTTVSPTTTTSGPQPGGADVGLVGSEYGSAVVIADDHVVVMNLDGSGDEVVTDRFAFGGAFPTGPELHPDGRRAFFSVGYEDGWYGCDTVQGDVFGVVSSPGEEPFLVGQGALPRVSPNGRYLAHL
ncbi:MAG: hypothetical protein ACI8Y4_000256 [Candidatus Poriferisodalaceae bacterium]|jgi:hypothetical protein